MVYNQLDNIDMALRREEAARQQEIDSASSSWPGGGFGLAGALKGKATAAVLKLLPVLSRKHLRPVMPREQNQPMK